MLRWVEEEQRGRVDGSNEIFKSVKLAAIFRSARGVVDYNFLVRECRRVALTIGKRERLESRAAGSYDLQNLMIF